MQLVTIVLEHFGSPQLVGFLSRSHLFFISTTIGSVKLVSIAPGIIIFNPRFTDQFNLIRLLFFKLAGLWPIHPFLLPSIFPSLELLILCLILALLRRLDLNHCKSIFPQRILNPFPIPHLGGLISTLFQPKQYSY